LRLQPRGEVSRGRHGVIGQHHELNVIVFQSLQEFICTGNHLTFFDEHAVHVRKVRNHWCSSTHLATSSSASSACASDSSKTTRIGSADRMAFAIICTDVNPRSAKLQPGRSSSVSARVISEVSAGYAGPPDLAVEARGWPCR